jgi:hypothetical protein
MLHCFVDCRAISQSHAGSYPRAPAVRGKKDIQHKELIIDNVKLTTF